MSDLPQSGRTDTQARRPARRLSWTLLICSITILFVLDFFVFRSPPPAAVTVIDESGTVSVLAVTPKAVPLCIFASPGYWPLKFRCDVKVRRVHFFELGDITPGQIWDFSLGFAWHWTRQGVKPVSGLLVDRSLPKEKFSPIQTTANDIKQNPEFVSLPGTVVTQAGESEADAVVILEAQDGKRAATRADRDGNFVLRIDPVWTSVEAELLVWGESGYVRIPQPIEILVDVPQVIRLQPYPTNEN